jgi:ribosomal protein L19
MNNIIKVIQNINNVSLNTKTTFYKNVKSGDIISVIYYDVEKEQVRVFQYSGVCLRASKKLYRTKINVKNYFGQTGVIKQFFLYSPFIVDVAILQKTKIKQR